MARRPEEASSADEGARLRRKTWNIPGVILDDVATASEALGQSETGFATDALEDHTAMVNAVLAGGRAAITIWAEGEDQPRTIVPTALFALEQRLARQRREQGDQGQATGGTKQSVGRLLSGEAHPKN